MNLRGHEIVLGFLLATAIWVVALTLTLSPTGSAGLWTVFKVFNDAGVAIGALATVAIAWFTWTLKKALTDFGKLAMINSGLPSKRLRGKRLKSKINLTSQKSPPKQPKSPPMPPWPSREQGFML
jgi:hypothetical protein